MKLEEAKKKYTAVISKDTGWWIGWIEEIPGINCQGKTKAEVEINLRSALRNRNAMLKESLISDIPAGSPVFEVALSCLNCGGEAFFKTSGGGICTSCVASVSCPSCAYRKDHEISWPKDAYYRVEVCADILWGWSRNHFVSIRDFIESKKRIQKYMDYSAAASPSHFLDVNRRDHIVRVIDRFLKGRKHSQ